VSGRIRSIKNSHLIGNRTQDLPVCSIVPQPTTLLLLTPEEVFIKLETEWGKLKVTKLSDLFSSMYVMSRWEERIATLSHRELSVTRTAYCLTFVWVNMNTRRQGCFHSNRSRDSSHTGRHNAEVVFVCPPFRLHVSPEHSAQENLILIDY
jgi:hypothetical protein